MSNFTREDLEAITVKDLRRMCVHDLSIVGMSKKTKPVVIDAILENQGASGPPTATITKGSAAKAAADAQDNVSPITEMNFFSRSRLTKPNAKTGNKFSTTCYMACGANDGNFTAVGNTIEKALATFGDILNADIKSTPLVNGEEVKRSYVLKEGDVVEFLKPAGQKG